MVLELECMTNWFEALHIPPGVKVLTSWAQGGFRKVASVRGGR